MYYGNAALVTAISGLSPSINSGWQSADYVWRTAFTATTTSLVIDFQMASQSNVYGFWDNVILKQKTHQEITLPISKVVEVIKLLP